MELFSVILIIVLFVVYQSLTKRIRQLEGGEGGTDPREQRRRIMALERRLKRLEQQVESETPSLREAPAVPASQDGPPKETAGVTVDDPLMQPDATARTVSPPPASRPRAVPARSAPEAATPSELQRHWQRIERVLVEHWTGILGAVVLVAGITFIGGYTGLRMAPVYRTLMIVGAAAVLVGGSYVLDRRAMWTQLAAWLRSSGAAVFLFACFASSGIPALSWISSLGPALAVLVLGVAANLYVAYLTATQAFASLHVVLSMIPLALLPQGATALLLATGVTVAGLGLALRSRWDLHALISLAAFAVFHAAWYLRVVDTLDDGGRMLGAAAAVLVAAMVAMIHYRKTRASESLEALPLLVHLANWALLATALGVYAGNTQLRGLALIAVAVIIFVLARVGRRRGIRWIYLTDTLVAQALVVVGLISFYPFVFHWLLVPPVLLLQSGLFLKIAIDEDEPLLERVGIHVVHAMGLAVAVAGLAALEPSRTIRNQNAVLLLTSALVAAGIHLYLLRVRGETSDSLVRYGLTDPNEVGRLSLVGVGAGVIAVVGLVNLVDGSWMETAALGAAGAFVILARRFGSQGLGVAAWLTLLTAFLVSWFGLLIDHPVPVGTQVVYQLGPLALAGVLAIGLPPPGPLRGFLRSSAIYLVGVHIGVAAYTLLQPTSPLIPGVAWLSLSLVALEIANRLREDGVTPVLHLGYAFLGAFAVAYILVVLQSQAYVGPFRVRMLIEGYALAVALYWWMYRPRSHLAEQNAWKAVHPLFLELALGFLAIVTLVEVPTQVRPVAWAALALACIAEPVGGRLDDRFRLYSLMFYWASALDVVIVTSGFALPSPNWYEHPGFTGTIAIVFQIAYLIVGSPRLALADLRVPPKLDRLARWGALIDRRQPLWIYYPFFVAGALFLYWRFDATLLTLLWSAEAFVVFALSLIIRESHFRYMALIGLGACVVRLLVVDMAQANLGLRGVVFVGVGLLMLGMNSLYTKYKDRLA